jgi:sugar (pentulose or hexulose) kinase
VAQRYLADALETSVTCLETAGEGGPWGMAVLAAYAVARGGDEPLEEFLARRVFKDAKGVACAPSPEGAAGFRKYMERFCRALDAERTICSMN